MRFEGYMHGINFGGWFSQCDHSEKRYDNFIKEADFERVARWGFDHVRIPVDYELVLNEDLTYREDGFKRIKDCIDWCEKYNLHMILGLHKTMGFSFDAGENENGFFENEHYQQIFYDLWEEFAKRFNRKHVAFELLNEVSRKSYCEVWNRIIRKTIEVIRKHAPETKILVGGYHNNSIEAIKDLDEPYDKNIVYNFHCYSPLVFTHQGAYWIDNMKPDFRLPFENTYGDYIKATRENVFEGFEDHFKKEEEMIDVSYFTDMFKEAVEIAQKYGVPLYCGEFGVIDRADTTESEKWFECITKAFDQFDIGRALWSYKEMDFGLVDAHYDGIRNKIIELV